MNALSRLEGTRGRVVTYPAPEGTPPSEDFIVRVNGEPVFVHQARVSAVPANQVWPGYQRPLEQTEIASFAHFDLEGKITVEVETREAIESVVVRPLGYQIVPESGDHRITFELSRPCQVVVEVNDWHHALHLFADPPETDRPDPTDPQVHYFGPGVHHPGEIKLHEGETAYLAGGAIVHGVIIATDASKIRVAGRGILDASSFGRSDAPQMITLLNCHDVDIEGIILRDPHVWTVVPALCSGVHMHNIKLIGLWRYNADGIDLVNSRNVVIENCFVRAFDDNIVLKGFEAWQGRPTDMAPLHNITVKRCVLWNDWGRALEIGAETRATAIHDVLFSDCDIIHFVHRAMDIQNGDRALIYDVRFEDIRVEDAIVEGEFRDDIPGYVSDPTQVGLLVELIVAANPYSKDTTRGAIHDITFQNVSAIGERWPISRLQGYDAEHTVQRILFEALVIQGKRIESLEAGDILTNAFVGEVTFA
jgi:hypothetical protein